MKTDFFKTNKKPGTPAFWTPLTTRSSWSVVPKMPPICPVRCANALSRRPAAAGRSRAGAAAHPVFPFESTCFRAKHPCTSDGRRLGRSDMAAPCLICMAPRADARGASDTASPWPNLNARRAPARLRLIRRRCRDGVFHGVHSPKPATAVASLYLAKAKRGPRSGAVGPRGKHRGREGVRHG